METIRISNLRCLADSTRIEIKPISLLVGANSSGKSTFVRLFPLLKQSHEIRTLGGLVLNEGDVDFGFFTEALRYDADPAEMKIEFGFIMKHGLFQGAPWNKFLSASMEAICELTYVKRDRDQRYPRLRGVSLTLKSGPVSDNVEVIVDEEGQVTKLTVNEFIAGDEIGSLKLRVSRGIIPRLIITLEKSDPDLIFTIPEPVGNPFDKILEAETKALFHGRTSKDTRRQMFQSIRIGSPHKMLEEMRNSGITSWQERVSSWTSVSPAFQRVRNLLLARRLNEILESVNVYVTQLASSVYYFQPVRANVQRDYPSRDAPITSVDPSGTNVAMLLASMAPATQKQFRTWMRDSFNFEVYPQSVSDGARVALRMKEVGTGKEFNLADTGFGFSQMLPFLVQIWDLVHGRAAQRVKSFQPRFYQHRGLAIPSSFVVAIEQPELHLHPALQAKLADLIVAMTQVSQKNEIPIRFVLETHSPTIIERIGQAVEAGGLKADDVQVLLFERDQACLGSNTAKVSTVSFDSEGILQNWPFGFLSAPVSEPVTSSLRETGTTNAVLH